MNLHVLINVIDNFVEVHSVEVDIREIMITLQTTSVTSNSRSPHVSPSVQWRGDGLPVRLTTRVFKNV